MESNCINQSIAKSQFVKSDLLNLRPTYTAYHTNHNPHQSFSTAQMKIPIFFFFFNDLINTVLQCTQFSYAKFSHLKKKEKIHYYLYFDV